MSTYVCMYVCYNYIIYKKLVSNFQTALASHITWLSQLVYDLKTLCDVYFVWDKCDKFEWCIVYN